MKKLILFCAIVSLIGIKNSNAVISGSAHDFSGESWSNGQICQPCHIPHNASDNPFTPLFGHDTTQVNYQDNLITMEGSVWGAVNGPSLMCLSCHDGTVALDSYGGNVGTEFIDPQYDIVRNDSSLAGNHPISIEYDETQTGLNSEVAVIASGLKLYNNGATMEIECGSCHDVHNTSNHEGLLWFSNAGSALCLTCHNK